MQLENAWEKELLQLNWWVVIATTNPDCIYYFGPFPSQLEAQVYAPGYIEDLEQEGAEKIEFQIKQCQPRELTIFNETLP